MGKNLVALLNQEKNMEQKSLLQNMPNGYHLCLDEMCPLKATCLRHLAVEAMTHEEKYWNIISPKHQAVRQGDCPDYRSNRKVVFAKGFLKILGEMSVNQAKSVFL